ncbi:hypothetical protein [Psychrosphaera haliotis]|uniref:Uncharacterized protein n=1 Tax=Psychrosphaera haliotis TaxID=555083 RepID=A0A6N8F995_9GAMM|nr:hypothetical protein [Psychrosphaera haliotis]MUH72009.1 hypothetical protein [Psychrosphaera haliotis]
MEIFDQIGTLFEMFRTGELHLLYLIVPLQIVIFAFPCLMLAQYKSKNLRYARALGLIPIINVGALFYYLFAAPEK